MWSCMVSMRALGVVVMMVHERITLSEGDFYDSHGPAKAKDSRDFKAMNIGVFCFPFRLHS